MTNHILINIALAGLLAISASAQDRNSAEALLRQAIDKELVDGDLKAAIEQYKKVIARAGTNRALAAKALVRLGLCYERQGDAEARQTYERVLREFGDQQEPVSQVKLRLAALQRTVPGGVALRQVWAGEDVDSNGTTSPDGRYLSFTSWGNGDLAILDLQTGEKRLVTHMPDGNLNGVESSVWSPDSKWIGYAYETPDYYELRVIRPDGSGMRPVYRSKESKFIDPTGWAPDGTRILAMIENPNNTMSVAWIPLNGGTPQVIASIPYGRGYGSFPRVSPDGKYVFYRIMRSRITPGDEAMETHVVGADGKGDNIVLEERRTDILAWAPGGTHLLYGGERSGKFGLWALPVKDGKAAGAPIMIRADLGTEQIFNSTLTTAGTFYFAMRTNTSDIHTASLDPATGKVTSVPMLTPTQKRTPNFGPQWSPDGRQLAYYSGPGREITIHTVATTQERKLLPKVPFTGLHSWGQDGKSMWINSGESVQKSRPVLVDATTGETIRTVPGSVTGRVVSFDANRRLATIMNGPNTIAVLDVETGQARDVVKLEDRPGVVLPKLSPDGNWIAYLRGYGATLQVAPSSGGEPKDLRKVVFPVRLQTMHGIAWSPDSRHVYFLETNQNQPYELMRVAAAGGAAEPMGLKLNHLQGLAISPDGTRIAFSMGNLNGMELWALDNFLGALK